MYSIIYNAMTGAACHAVTLPPQRTENPGHRLPGECDMASIRFATTKALRDGHVGNGSPQFKVDGSL